MALSRIAALTAGKSVLNKGGAGLFLSGLKHFGRAGSGAVIGPIGLDVGAESINLVQLKYADDGVIGLRAAASVRFEGGREALLAAPAQFKARLAEALRRQPFSGRRVVTAMPAQSVRILPVPYELSGGRNDAVAIGQVLKDRLDGDLTQYVVDFMPVRTDPHITERLALVVVARREPVLGMLELLRQSRLDVEALEIGPSAIKRLIGAISKSDSFQNHLVINFGETSSYMTVVSGRRLLQDQEVMFGERALLEQIGAALEVSTEEARRLIDRYGFDPARCARPDEAEVATTLAEIVKPRLLRLVEEINRVLIYTASESRGASVGHIHLLGSLSHWRGIEAQLHALVEIPVSGLNNPLGLFGAGGAGEDRQAQSLVIATGLALRGMRADE